MARSVREVTLKERCMLRILSSATSIGPRADKQAPFFQLPLAVIRMNMEREKISEHGSAIDISTWRRSTFIHTHTQNIPEKTNQLIVVYGEERM